MTDASTRRGARAGLALALLAALAPASAAAQGTGTAAAELLRMTAGARAGAFAGAYTAITGDADAVFYNPAALAGRELDVGAAYQSYVEGVTLGSAAGVKGFDRLAVGFGLVFLDAGRIDEIVPDPEFGGERGRPTGQTVGATEYVARLGLGMHVLDGKGAVGAGLGRFGSNLAGTRSGALFLDLGGLYHATDALVLGGALRHLGTRVSGDGAGAAPLPLEARVGASYRHATEAGLGGQLATDLVLGAADRTLGLAVGIEGGLVPRDEAYSAVLRLGLSLGESDGHLGRVVVGGGVGLGGIALDYALQWFEFLGAIHRIGFRWSP